jgi:putative peptide zinc metalloprotease protein
MKSLRQEYFLFVFTLLRLFFVFLVVLTVFMFVIHSLFKSAIFITNIGYMEFNYITVIEVLKKIAILVLVFIIIKKYSIAIFYFLRRQFSK